MSQTSTDDFARSCRYQDRFSILVTFGYTHTHTQRRALSVEGCTLKTVHGWLRRQLGHRRPGRGACPCPRVMAPQFQQVGSVVVGDGLALVFKGRKDVQLR